MNRHLSFVLALAVLYRALVSGAESADPPEKPKFRPVPFLREDGPPLVMIQRGSLTWLGDFDRDGNFIPHPKCPPNLGANGGSGLPNFVLPISGKMFVYEHRSGRLIRGTTVKFGVFVPEIGSTILNIKMDYDSTNPDRLIHNMLDETALKVWDERMKKPPLGGFPKPPEPSPTGIPEGYEFTPFSKSHPTKPIKHARAIGDIVEFGHLSDEGEFIPDPDLPPVSRAGILGPIKFDPFGTPRYYTVPQQTGPKREGQKETTEAVYEYRSGRLIKGTLQENGNFVPELGSKVIDFKDYGPNFPRRIYNLPGVLKKKAE